MPGGLHRRCCCCQCSYCDMPCGTQYDIEVVGVTLCPGWTVLSGSLNGTFTAAWYDGSGTFPAAGNCRWRSADAVATVRHGIEPVVTFYAWVVLQYDGGGAYSYRFCIGVSPIAPIVASFFQDWGALGERPGCCDIVAVDNYFGSCSSPYSFEAGHGGTLTVTCTA